MITITKITLNSYYNDIKQYIKITDVFEKLGLRLIKKGKRYTALCPFHRDTNPSLVLYPESYHCFACNAHGDIFSIIKKIKGCPFQDAVTWLEIEFPYITEYKPRITKSLESSNAYVIAYNCYKNMIVKEKKELSKFAEQRKYEVGFLHNAEIFYVTGNKLLNSVNGDIEKRNILVEGKLLKEKIVDDVDINNEEAYLQDTFYSDRVVLALRDYNDHLVGFAGRAINTKPKYLFTQELPKSNLLYRLNVVKNKCKADKNEVCELYITEGVFDALRLEYNGFYAVSVLGSHITKDQVKILGKFIKEMDALNKEVVLYLFLDTDNAGIKGAFDSITNLWSHRLTRKTRIDVVINKQELVGLTQNYESKGKDPDEILKELNVEECGRWIKLNTIDVFDFLLRYLYDNETLIFNKNGVSLENVFDAIEPIEKLSIMARLKGMLSVKIWDDVIEYYNIFENNKIIFKKFSSYIYSKKIEVESTAFIPPSTEAELFIRAISIAKNSYAREEVVIDDFSWDRIQFCADVFITYLQDILMKEISEVHYGRVNRVPMLAVNSPKKHNEFRLKMQYIHEQLILQQYVLNALLSSDGYNHEYEEYIPAVRYDKMSGKVYTTGLGYYDFYRDLGIENVSFAYQINMASINGLLTNEGMYRPFYECWSSFIQYIKEGINAIEAEIVYKVRLDIKKYYERIPLYAVRNMLISQLKHALAVSGDKFPKLLGLDADKITDWINSQVFGYQYYDAENGKISKCENELYGIPQGPNMSSYLANIILFPMDKRITEYISLVNSKDKEQNDDNQKTVHVRYARYVDDMVIVSDSPEHLNAIKEIIVNELQKLGLELSPKTDEAEEICKQDAINWLTDERGGLGVSSVYDFPDDSLESILDQYDFYETVNRRDALKLLNNMMFDFDQIDDNVLVCDIVESVFKTEEIRYNDIARFSEMILRYIIRGKTDQRDSNNKYENHLLKAYEEIWNENVKKSPPKSMFQRNGLCFFSFIDGIIRILKPDNGMNRNIDEQKMREKDRLATIEFIIECDLFQELDDRIRTDNDILELNKNVLRQKILQIIDLSIWKLPELDNTKVTQQTRNPSQMFLEKYEASIRNIFEDYNNNEYARRWIYSIFYNFRATNSGERLMSFLTPLSNSSMKENPISAFHFFTTRLISCRTIEEYIDCKNLFSETYSMSQSTIFDNCMLLWFDSPQANEHSCDNSKKIALKTLTNIINKSIIVSVFDQSDHLKKFLFNDAEGMHYLPVPPGLNYNGIFALSIVDEKKGKVMRADLNEDLGKNFLDLKWKNCSIDIDCIYLYSSNINGRNWISLAEYFKDKNPTPGLVHDVSKKYREIVSFIYASHEKFALSKHHIFLDKENKINVLSYETESETSVAVSNGSNALKTIYVNPNGNIYWKAGQIMFDALSIGNAILGERNYSTLFLVNSLKRLTGYYEYNTLTSVKKSVERTLQLLDGFPEYVKAQQIYVLDSKIINSFIEYRMNNLYLDDRAMAYHLYRWSQKCLGKYYKDLLDIFGNIELGSLVDIIKRRSSWSYLSIAHKISKIIESVHATNIDFLGLKALKSGLILGSVLENIRMQVLERIVSLNQNEVNELKKFTDKFSEMKLVTDFGDEDVKYIANPLNHANNISDLQEIANDLLCGNNVESIKYITLEGWLVLLYWLLEVDKSSNYVTSLRIKNHDKSLILKLRSNLTELSKKFQIDYVNDKDTDEDIEYPFDIVKILINYWNEKNSLDVFKLLNEIDEIDGVVIETISSKFFSKNIERTSDNKYSKVSLELAGQRINNMPLYFITEAHVGKSIRNMEYNNAKETVWSQSKINNEISGVSAISNIVFNLAKGSEIESPKEKQNNINLEEKDLNQDILTATPDAIELISNQENANVEQKSIEKGEIEEDFDEILVTITELQDRNWKNRRRKFKTMDRIALFQFDVDDSYQHPISEICLNQLEGEKDNFFCEETIRDLKKHPDKWDHALLSKKGIRCLNSCAEFRRRKLLEKVFIACGAFDIDLLILPEYSVRPETVSWMYDHIIHNGYKFSVWAGTFRIVPDYNLDKDVFSDLFIGTTMDPTCYWAAVLPIICNEQQKNVPGAVLKKDKFPRTIAKKFKKYPAISLQEFINPSKTIAKQLEPVAKTFDMGTIFGDARDDVIELICSEMFIMMSPSNIESFALASYNLYKNFQKLLPDYDMYLKEIRDDIIEFGKRTAINNSRGKYYRTPIILVPAYTTRAIDYYVAGQAGYLSSGITTVFCNAVGPQTEGGSCIIGTDCWDNRNGNTTVSYIPVCSPYHGVTPGIYKQFYEYKDRGGLGREEQALLICDINPNISFYGKPNPQSLGKCLELVAHLPIIESHKSKRKDCFWQV